MSAGPLFDLAAPLFLLKPEGYRFRELLAKDACAVLEYEITESFGGRRQGFGLDIHYVPAPQMRQPRDVEDRQLADRQLERHNAGVVKELKVKVGDKVSKGSVVLVLETAERST